MLRFAPALITATVAAGLLAGCATDPATDKGAPGTQTAKAESQDRGQMCIPVRTIRRTQVIDESTILVEMQDRTKFIRINLAGRCSGLGFYGFAYVSHNDELCRTDPLTLVGMPVPPVCLIDSMIPIDKAAADALKAKPKTDGPTGGPAGSPAGAATPAPDDQGRD
ncbi:MULTISPECIES: DUF6491 family protein [Nitrospirillum]|uniref:Lipoprotein n=2 Tax=Nitrospirillum TaxID=1543705 RepID=A0A248JRJ4_9PROT|nr:DUF6491 family protein [Nitrospirillum amazonense]ASG21362.1 hypothetical protein Y958_11375 [Nitrospirillum amazonense CBAmc]MEC4593102.1 DUF6491 family protein [Nitrospirillum amazonense]TWB17341.1 hypothetical protein FBZ88_1259 [Nitrospirillum amazonense]TWB33035.1 hypothetical protein FBZ91_11597 [Nitrospirillum amazonense]